jgi:hypothetical protein
MWGLLFVNRGTLILLTTVIFICLVAPTLPVQAQLASPTLVADQSLYSIWKLGGPVRVTASNLVVNASYSIWLQRPTDPSTRASGIQFIGTGNPFQFQVNITRDDPSGTYLVSLSTSNLLDNSQAVAHFGVFGTDSAGYRRTQQIMIAGGGFSPNSTVTINATIAGQRISGSPFTARANTRGDFSYAFRAGPSFTLGVLVFTAIGTSFDSGQTANAATPVTITSSAVKVDQSAQPSTPVQRTARVSTSYQLRYVDGSPVTNSTPSSRNVKVVSNINGSIVANAAISLADPTTGMWTTSWVPPPSANLTRYHFEFNPSSFDDSYGNLGNGTTLISQDFLITPAITTLQFQANSTLQRRQNASVTIIPKYNDGSNFVNVTRPTGTLTSPSRVPQTILLNRTLQVFVTRFEVIENATLGNWTVSANINDIFGNSASGSFTILVTKATLVFAVNYPATPERTTLLNVTAKVTYPDGGKVGPGTVPKGFNVTLTRGNFTWNHTLAYNQTTGAWSAGYRIPQNATLGDYAFAMKVEDSYGNGGQFASTSKVILARFRITVLNMTTKANSQTPVSIGVLVKYPNGSALVPSVGGRVTASMTDSSGTVVFPMVFNASDRSWRLIYTTPSLGLSFGVTLSFSFTAQDKFGNTGTALNAYDLEVGAAVGALVLSAIIGGIIPIILSVWAILTVTAKKRKHKP